MRKSDNIIALTTAFCLLVFVALSCGGSSTETSKNIEPISENTTPVANNTPVLTDNGGSSNAPSPINSIANDESAKSELKKFPWVKDLYVSPGYMNVGVIRSEKNWKSPMIGRMVCGILKRTRSGLSSVRFVDIEEVAYQQKSPRQAEIHSLDCK